MSSSKLVRVNELAPGLCRAAAAAVQASRRSYAPYSNFHVGAALVHVDEELTTGANYENCTLQACCAERCAIVRANVEGRRTARAIAIYGTPAVPAAAAAPRGAESAKDSKVSLSEVICPPCGLCRQLLIEVAELSGNLEHFEVILVTRDEQHARVVRLIELLPLKFGPADMGMNLARLRDS